MHDALIALRASRNVVLITTLLSACANPGATLVPPPEKVAECACAKLNASTSASREEDGFWPKEEAISWTRAQAISVAVKDFLSFYDAELEGDTGPRFDARRWELKLSEQENTIVLWAVKKEANSLRQPNEDPAPDDEDYPLPGVGTEYRISKSDFHIESRMTPK